MPTLIELVQKSTAYLGERGIDNARREAEWIFAATLGLSRLDLYTRYDMPVDGDELVTLRERIQRRGQREPLAYVLGTQPFAGLELVVGPAVLVPRPETEELVERVLAAHGEDALQAVDIGTGSGAIALALKQARPAWTVHAVEQSAAALKQAQANAEACALEIVFHHGDLMAPLEGRFDVVVANLPYVGTDERELCDPELAFEPQEALFAGADGMTVIRRLLAALPGYLADRGCAWLEHGFRQGAAVRDAAAEHGLQAEILTDGAGQERFARVTLVPGV